MQLPKLDSAAWQRLQPYFDRALDLTPRERTTWMVELTATEPDIADALRELLHEHDLANAQDYLEQSPSSVIASTAIASRVGQRVGPYTIDRLLGRGGMGDVWLAKRSDGRFEGSCAIKFLEGTLVTSKLAERFRREGQVLARLAHPHIARLLDAGAADDGAPYLALEYVDGERIDAFADAKQLSIVARVRLFIDVIAAVAHAHTQLVIHRDLKPSNVLVTADGQVKLLDFGIAKLLSTEHDDALTRVEEVALTPEYAAPEQMLGELPSTATDVYQLGMLLYVLLIGRHPLQIAGTRAERMRAALDGVVPQASTLASTSADQSIRKHLRGDLDAILAKALRKLPSERYATAQALQEDIQRYLSDEPVHARRGATLYRARKFVGRHRVAVVVSSAAVTGLCAALVFALLQMQDARRQRDAAVVHSSRADAQIQVNEFLLSDSSADSSNEAQRARLQRARQMIKSRFRNEPMIQAKLLLGLSGRYIDLGDYSGATLVMQDADALAQKINDAHLSANIACGRAYDAVQMGNLPLARQQEVLGRQYMARLKEVPGGLQAECGMSTSMLAEMDGDFDRSIAVLASAMRTLEREGEQQSSRYTSVGLELMGAHLGAGNYGDAWKTVRTVIKITEDTGRADSSGYHVMVNNAARALALGGQPGEALRLIDTTIAAARKDNPDHELPYFFLATREMTESLFLGAAARPGKLLEFAATAEKQGSLQLAQAFRLAAVNSELDSGAVDAAVTKWASLREAETALSAKANEQYRNLARLLVTHARLDFFQDHLQSAAQRVEQAVALLSPHGLAINPEFRGIACLRAEIKLALGDPASARNFAQQAIDRARVEAIDRNASWRVGEALLLRARSELGLGKTQDAAASAQEALRHLEKTVASSHALIKTARLMATPPRA